MAVQHVFHGKNTIGQSTVKTGKKAKEILSEHILCDAVKAVQARPKQSQRYKEYF